MAGLFLENTPEVMGLIPDGYVNLQFTQKIGQDTRLIKQNVTYQVKLPSTVTNVSSPGELGAEKVGVVTPDVLRKVEYRPFASALPEGYTPNNAPIIVVGRAALEKWLNGSLIGPARSIQTRNTVYKKIQVQLFYSKAKALVQGPGNLSSLRNYQDYKFTCSPDVCGNINDGTKPAIGAITINQYVKEPSESVVNSVMRRQQDKPGRYLIRGCGISQEEALRGTTIAVLTRNLSQGSLLDDVLKIELIPVVDVLGDLWTVRSAQSAGYNRVAAQRNKLPTDRLDEGGKE